MQYYAFNCQQLPRTNHDKRQKNIFWFPLSLFYSFFLNSFILNWKKWVSRTSGQLEFQCNISCLEQSQETTKNNKKLNYYFFLYFICSLLISLVYIILSPTTITLNYWEISLKLSLKLVWFYCCSWENAGIIFLDREINTSTCSLETNENCSCWLGNYCITVPFVIMSLDTH